MSNKKHNHSDNITLVQKFVDIMNNNNLSELEYESNDVKLKISNKVVNTNSNTSAVINQNPEEKLIQNTPDEKTEKFSHDHQGAVNSPMVGTAYSSSESGKEPFVKMNSSVIKGDTLLIIEAMKVMNIITAHKSGKIIFIGFVVAAHWICFFEAIKVSNVSVTLACLSSASLFVAVLEPLFYKRKIIFYEVLLGALVIVGLGMIFNFEPQYSLGIVLAIASAFFAAIFSTVNGLFVREASPSVISFYEMVGGVVGISLYLLIMQPENGIPIPSQTDLIYLLILGLICTAFAFVISVEVLKTLSPFTSSISINMEPVYAIFLALFFFGDSEKMTVGFYSGALLIFLTILSNAWFKSRLKTTP